MADDVLHHRPLLRRRGRARGCRRPGRARAACAGSRRRPPAARRRPPARPRPRAGSAPRRPSAPCARRRSSCAARQREVHLLLLLAPEGARGSPRSARSRHASAAFRPSSRTIRSNSCCSGVLAELSTAERSRFASTASSSPIARVARLSASFVSRSTSSGVGAMRAAKRVDLAPPARRPPRRGWRAPTCSAVGASIVSPVSSSSRVRALAQHERHQQRHRAPSRSGSRARRSARPRVQTSRSQAIATSMPAGQAPAAHRRDRRLRQRPDAHRHLDVACAAARATCAAVSRPVSSASADRS